jgi:hypothetical protein
VPLGCIAKFDSIATCGSVGSLHQINVEIPKVVGLWNFLFSAVLVTAFTNIHKRSQIVNGITAKAFITNESPVITLSPVVIIAIPGA